MSEHLNLVALQATKNRTRNNGRSTANNRRNLSFDLLKYIITSHSERQLLVHLKCVFYLWNHVSQDYM